MDFIVKAVIALAAAMLGAYLWSNWDEVRDSVSSWLRANGLAESALMDAWIVFERVTNRAKRFVAKVFAKTKETGVVQVEEKSFDNASEVPDADVRAELERRGMARKNLMTA